MTIAPRGAFAASSAFRDRLPMVMHDGARMIEASGAVKSLGVHLSVDDFGTGYSDSAAIVRTIIALGRNLGLKVLAEGVDSDELQGYWFSKPVSAWRMSKILGSCRGSRRRHAAGRGGRRAARAGRGQWHAPGL